MYTTTHTQHTRVNDAMCLTDTHTDVYNNTHTTHESQ